MSGIEPFQFEPTYSPGEEPVDDYDEEFDRVNETDSTENSRIGNTEWCTCGVCVSMASEDECFCCQELEELNQKFDESGLCLSLQFCPTKS